MKKFVLYRLTFPNGKLYFGITTQFKERMRSHKAKEGVCPPSRLAHAIQKYGWASVVVDILHENLDDVDAYALEIKYISEHNTTGVAGYNIAPGGRTKLGCKNSKPSPIKGKKLSEHHRQALIRAKAGKSYSAISSDNSTLYPVICFNHLTGKSFIYKNASVFGNENGINIYTVYNHIYRNSKLLNKHWTVRKYEQAQSI